MKGKPMTAKKRTAPLTAGDLTPLPENPRTATPEALAALERSMERYGDLSGIVFNRRSGHLVAGHQRLKHFDPASDVVIAERLKKPNRHGTTATGYVVRGEERWTYREVDADEQTELEMNVRANVAAGAFEPSGLASIVAGLRERGADLEGVLGFTAEQVEALAATQRPVPTDAELDEVPPPPAEPVTRPGDLITLSRHRLLCGDSRSAKDIGELMGGGMAAMLWTDPPYGVSYTGKTKDALEIENDGAEGLLALLTAVFKVATSVLVPGAPFYCAHPAGARSLDFAAALAAAGLQIHQTLVWVKDSMVLGHSDYHYRHEPVLYGYFPGPGRSGRGKHKGSRWFGGNAETSVFEVPRPKASPDHPTGKPVELVARQIGNSSEVGDVVLDPFAGSGTTLIACERLRRDCRVMEIDPGYCDVICARWERLTGQKADRPAR